MHAQHIPEGLLEEATPTMHAVRREALTAAVASTLNGATLSVTALGRGMRGEALTYCHTKRSFPGLGNICLGARTMRGADRLYHEYKYIPVRRTALFIMESLYQGLKWVAFEPNDESLWAHIRLNATVPLSFLAYHHLIEVLIKNPLQPWSKHYVHLHR